MMTKVSNQNLTCNIITNLQLFLRKLGIVHYPLLSKEIIMKLIQVLYIECYSSYHRNAMNNHAYIEGV